MQAGVPLVQLTIAHLTRRSCLSDKVATSGARPTSLSAAKTVAAPAALADRLAAVMEGMYASVRTLGAVAPALQSRRVRKFVDHVRALAIL
jgi:hypothetical protein